MRRHRLTLQRQTQDRDRVLGIPPTWEDVTDVLATIDEIASQGRGVRETTEGGRMTDVSSLVVRFRWAPTAADITTQHRLKRSDGTTYHMHGIRNVGEANRVIECVVGTDQ